MILFQPETKLSEKDSLRLREEGQNLAESLQCPFLDEDWDEIKEGAVIEDSLRALVESIKHRASGHLSIGPPLSSHTGAPDLRVIMCLHCGDPFNIEAVLGPLLGHSTCHQSGQSGPHSASDLLPSNPRPHLMTEDICKGLPDVLKEELLSLN